MKIYQTLLRRRADNCIAATYNVDLPFFEYLVFEKLYPGGCRNTAVLCDPAQYQLALDDVPLLKYLGQRYLCVPCTAAGASFHPKIVLLTSSQSGLLLMGSNNLSRSGLVRNLEVATRFEYSAKDSDGFGKTACRWAYDYLLELAKREKDPNLDERMARLWSTTGWLRQAPQMSTLDGFCWLIHNLHAPILDQLVQYWQQNEGTPVEEAVIVSPYYDREAAALDALLRRLEPEEVFLVTQPRAPGLNPEKVRALLSDSRVRWGVQQPEAGSRRLHAKVLALRTERGSWVLSGSPNFSSPALLRSTSGGNA